MEAEGGIGKPVMTRMNAWERLLDQARVHKAQTRAFRVSEVIESSKRVGTRQDEQKRFKT